jgi:hypothetical protein
MFSTSIKITGKYGMSDLSILRAITVWEAEIAPALLAEVKRRAPVYPQGGGRLRDSMYLSRRSSGQGLEARIMSSAPYAEFVVRGTSPHIIEPKSSLALHWSGKGSDVYAARVNHPGNKANPFVQQAISALMPMMTAKLRTRVQEEFE